MSPMKSREPLLREPEGLEGPLAFESRQTHYENQQRDQYPQHPLWRLADHGAPPGVARQSKWAALRSRMIPQAAIGFAEVRERHTLGPVRAACLRGRDILCWRDTT